MALVAWGWHPKHPDLFEAFSWKWSPSEDEGTNTQSISEQIVKQIHDLEARGFNFVAKVADTGGGGRMFVEEVMLRHSMSFEAAKKTEKAEQAGEFLHQGIASRAFERRFQLADHVKVTGAKLANGLLTIELQREIPEEKKPRAIPVQAGNGQPALTH